MTEKQDPAMEKDYDLSDMVADADTGGRVPTGALPKAILWWTPLIWSLYQLWIASPLPFILRFGVMNDTQTRAIHLAFAMFLAFIAFPAFKSSPRRYIPWETWVAALIAAFSAAYLAIFYDSLAGRSGAPIQQDIIIAGIGLVCLLEAARRSLGFPLMGVALFFLAYVFFGSSDILPEMIQWKGASFEKAMSHMWLTTEGVFGVALGVSSGFVFLYVLFGALLNEAGAGNYFIKVAFSLLGHLRGGPAKAAVVSSAMTGMISGSSIANVVTTGTFTIPLMRKVGFSPEKAGAVEVSSSVNGVLTPPVMGAVAFLMTEYVGVTYIEVVKTAIIPALISYIALVYIVHLEALKQGMEGLERATPPSPLKIQLLRTGIILTSFIILCYVLFYAVMGIEWVFADLLGLGVGWPVAVFVAAIYFALLYMAAKAPDLDEEEIETKLPAFGDIYKAGLYYITPIGVLMWFLMVERKSPGFSAFWASCFLLFILFTQKAAKSWLRKDGNKVIDQLRVGFSDMCESLVIGARNMIGLACAMGVAGIIVGAVTLTGIGQVMAEFVEYLSGGNLLAMLFFVALISIILGMGLPTTANYIVVSSLMAGVVVELGAAQGLIVPLIAVHMFCFYFGIMADVTPPVGLASFAAAAISRGDPLRTGFQAFFYSLRTAALPFLFIFNTDLLLIDVTPGHAIVVFFSALAAMLLFAAGTMGYFLTRSRLWESAMLLFVAFILFRPDWFLDQYKPEFSAVPGTELYQLAQSAPDNASLQVRMTGINIEGDEVDKTFLLPLGAQGPDGAARLADSAGVEFRNEDGKEIVDGITFAGPAESLGVDWDFEVVEIHVENDRPPYQIFYIPAIALFGLVYFVQRRRRDALAAA